MKVLIYILSVIFADIISYALKVSGIASGAIPSIVVMAIMLFFVAPFFCKRLDERKSENCQEETYETFRAVDIELQEVCKAQKWMKPAIIALTIVCIILSCACANMYESYIDAIEKNTKLSKEISTLRGDYNTLYLMRKSLTERLDSMEDEYDFYRDFAVIVTTAGEKYHKYGCKHIAGRDFWIFNTEYAIYKGYEPCKDCIG